MAYGRSAKPNYGLDLANCYIADLGAPALADDDWVVVDVAMKVGTYLVAHASPVDGLARNVTVIRTVGGNADTPGTIIVAGTDVDGRAVSDTIAVGTTGVTVVGVVAFKTVTSVTGAGWVINQAADTVKVGFGDKIGLPSAIRQSPPILATTQIPFVVLGTTLVAATVTWDANIIAKCTVDAATGTYNGSKRLLAFVVR